MDFSISTRELASLIKSANIDFLSLPDEEFDAPLGESTGAAVIFGATGGVIEAAVRTAYEIYTGKKLDRIDFKELRGLDGIRHATIDFNGTPINIGIAHTLGNARKLLDGMRAGMYNFHAIEIMAPAFPSRGQQCHQGPYGRYLPRGCRQEDPQVAREPLHYQAVRGVPRSSYERESASPAAYTLFRQTRLTRRRAIYG